MNDKNYGIITTNVFQKYVYINFQDLSFLETFSINFESWIKKNWEAIDDST